MTNVDQFESLFRSAAKERFEPVPVVLRRGLVVTDLAGDDAARWAGQARRFLGALDARSEAPVEWSVVEGDRFRSVRDLIDLVAAAQPDIVVTYRNLHTDAWRWPYVLGDHLEVLTQEIAAPVVVLPHPQAPDGARLVERGTSEVMAITDHLTGDHRLVSHAAHFTAPGGTLYLTHIEDDFAWARILDAIGKVPEIDTDLARELIPKQLLKEPRDFIASFRDALEAAHESITVKEDVRLGHRLRDYRALVQAHEVDLLVLNTKDEDQLAMHGLAYPLAVELRSIGLLML